jgi:hypothetical protein
MNTLQRRTGSIDRDTAKKLQQQADEKKLETLPSDAAPHKKHMI